MPIKTQIDFRHIDETEFKEMDFFLMGEAFQLQNDMGRLFDEDVFRDRLQEKLLKRYECVAESGITLTHKTYSTRKRMDLVVDGGLICELKVVERLTPAHKSQLLEYMILSEVTRGKLINFGSPSVEGKLTPTNLTHERRRNIEFDASQWEAHDEKSRSFRDLLSELALDWGVFLRASTWIDAMTELLGGAHNVVMPVKVTSNSNRDLTQCMHLLTPDTAFRITAITSSLTRHENNLRKQIDSTELNRIQWANFNHQQLEFRTVVSN